MKKRISIFMISMMCLLNLVGCSEKKENISDITETTQSTEATETIETTEVTTETELSDYNKNIPEEYKDLFVEGSFDENMVWTTNNSEHKEFIESIQPICEESMYGSVILANDEEVIFAGGWNAIEIDGETTVNPYTTYEVGSLTKPITATGILQLVQEGKLQTNETIDKYFPEYPYGEKITIDHLLHMQSGIPDLLNSPLLFFGNSVEEGKDHHDIYDKFVYNGELSADEMLNCFYKTDLCFEPGSTYMYSNTNYVLLANILEQITGQTYEEYIKENIFEVCGMKNSTCTEIGNITSVPMPNGEKDYTKWGRAMRGAGDIHSNVCDFLLWCRALMNTELINETQLTYMTTPSQKYACGWFEKDGGLSHSGHTLTYVAWIYVYRTEETNYYSIYMTPYALISNKTITQINDIFNEYIYEGKINQ